MHPTLQTNHEKIVFLRKKCEKCWQQRGGEKKELMEQNKLTFFSLSHTQKSAD